MQKNPIRVGNLWIFPGGKTLPVVSGGDGPEDDPNTITLPAEGGQQEQKPERQRNEKGQFTPAERAAVEQQAEANAPSVGETNPQTGEMFTAEQVAKIRQEEKDKLYGQIEAMRSKIDTLAAAEEERQRQIAEAEAEAARQREEAEKAEMTALERVTHLEQEFQRRQQELEASIEAERAVFEQERRLNALEQYKSQRLVTEQEHIMPELLDMVRGSTEEEIEASISLAREKTSAILANVQAAMGQAEPPGQQAPPQPAPGVGPQVTAPPVGPMDNQSNYQTLTAEDISAMSMEEYAQHRERLLQGLRGHVQNSGIYG